MSMRRNVVRFIVLLALALAGVSAARGVAAACECAGGTPTVILPRDGATGVPLNTRILVSSEKVGEGKWAGADASKPAPALSLAPIDGKGKSGAPVESTVSSMLSEAWGTVYVITPKKPLKANTTYALVTVVKKKATTRFTSFTTGAAADTAPPVFAGIERFTAIIGHQVRTKCSSGDPPYNQLSWDYGSATDEGTAAEDLVRILYIQRKGEQRSIRIIEPGASAPVMSIDGTICDAFHPTFKAGDEICATVEIVDLAGNASGTAIEKCMAARKM
jgi:hypothetical protein